MNFVLFLILTIAMVAIQCLIGGTRLACALGPYALIGGAAVFSLSGIRRACIKPSAWCIGSALLLFAYVLGRAAFSPSPYLARADVLMAMAGMSVYLITAIYLCQPRFRTGLALALCIVTTAQVFVGAIQFTDGTGYMLFGYTRPEIFGIEASGLFTNPSHLAAYLEIAGLFAASYTIWGRYHLPMKFFIGYLLLVCIGGLAITGSKAGYLGAVSGLVVFAAISVWVVHLYREAQFPLALIGSAILVIAILGSTVWMMKSSLKLAERMAQISRVEKDVRKYHWAAALDQIKTDPVLGTGVETHPAFQRLFRRAPVQTDATNAHSDYLEILAQYGALGGGLVAIFLLTHIVSGFLNIKDVVARRLLNTFGPPKTNSLALTVAALSATIALLIHSAFDSTLHTPANILLWGFVFGILSNAGLNKESQAAPGIRSLTLRGALGALGVVLLAASVYWFHAERLTEKAHAAFERHDYPHAAALAQRAIKAGPANPENYYVRGESLRNLALQAPVAEREPLYQEAVDVFRSGLEQSPDNENLWIRLGQALDATGQHGAAEEAFVQGIAADPNLGVLYSYYAEHLRITGDPDGAQECATTAKKLMGPLRKLTELDDPLPILTHDAPPVR
ncbi:MAG: O-antigen ligase family protein [Chthoniobacteraceae bacterium]